MNKAAICICTYKRDALLLKLINNLLNQKIKDDIVFDIYIVDNYGESDIRNRIKELNKKNIYYFIEKNRGISQVRNRCIKEAKKLDYQYCIFLDDDEAVEKIWLNSIINCAISYNANIVVGPLISIYPDDTPNWIIKSEFFKHKTYFTGTELTSCGSGNTLINMKLINEGKVDFDEKYGLTGGEDTKLFKTLVSKGEKIIFCNEAIAYEEVDIKRLNMKYMLKRMYVNSLVYVKIEKELYNKFNIAIKRLLSSIASILIGILIIPIAIVKGKLGIFQAMNYVAKGTGQFSGIIGYTKKLY